MVDLVLENLLIILYAVILLGLAMLSNTCFGLWYNVKKLKKNFNFKKILESILKFLVFAIGLSALSVLITLLPVYAQYSGIQLAEEVYDIINLIAIVTIFISSIINYTKQAIEKLRNILDGSDSNG